VISGCGYNSRMLSKEQTQQVAPKLLATQLVIVAMLIGLIALVAVICFALVDFDNLNPRIKMLTLIGFVAGMLLFGLSVVVPKIFATDVPVKGNDEAAESSAISAIVNAMFTENVARAAVIEGGVFLNAIVFMLEPHIASLVVIGIGVLLMLASFPLRNRQLATLEERFEQFKRSAG